MEITYELTQKDFTQAFFAHRNRKPVMKWTRRIIILLLIGLFVFLLFGATLAHNIRPLLPMFGIIILWIAVASGVTYWWSARRQFRKQPGAQGQRSLLLDASGTHWRWDGGNSDVEWKNYIRTVEGKDQILFYTSPVCFNILPKRALAPEQLPEIRDLLKQNIPASR